MHLQYNGEIWNAYTNILLGRLIFHFDFSFSLTSVFTFAKARVNRLTDLYLYLFIILSLHLSAENLANSANLKSMAAYELCSCVWIFLMSPIWFKWISGERRDAEDYVTGFHTSGLPCIPLREACVGGLILAAMYHLW